MVPSNTFVPLSSTMPRLQNSFAVALACVTKQNRHVLVHHDLVDAGDAFLLKRTVADGKRLVDDENLRIYRHGERESQTRLHAAGIRAHRLVDIQTQLSEIDDSRLDFGDFLPREAKDLPRS